MSDPRADEALTSVLVAVQAIKCADCDFTILPGQHMSLWLDGWRHITCLPTTPTPNPPRSAA